MIRSSFAALALGIGLLVFGNAACGDKPPPKPPESNPSSDSDGGAMSSGDSDGGGGGGGDTKTGGGETPTPPPAAAALPLPTAAAKIKVEGKKKAEIEIKSDGTVSTGGKPSGKITGMELQDKDGKTQLKVDSDGNITTGEGAAYAKFEGDELASLTGTKYSVGDDGALSSSDDKGKKAAMGKAEGVGSAKKTVLLAVAFNMWGLKAPAPKAGGKKPGDKPAGDKPAGKK